MNRYHVFITYDAEHRVDYDKIYADSPEQAQAIAMQMWNDTNKNAGRAKNLKSNIITPTK